ncbi:Bug family tripartite tricarboxylate transporter substrate binding protein [Falsiroseomonas stagni]|uniref:Tripartite-type tricarboxylate transporter, receptor component TctC n=1 Tax=Falsiroseomonas stagni DSM 19981 TaxID=1123062 RepID=A0A1I3ZBV3_9PROT|nr:tripartite tricarboxylate transporter substrate binding protein [Falsiroseomonas stagni]SFK41505.1 Tripartite-type tricarboxylate transporter, receptor component TctC [Falsiroseomonas stagni DSM 19981]
MLRRLLAIAVMATLSLSAAAQSPPRLVNGFAPGGTADIVARLLADLAGPALGTRPVVETRTGATGFIAAEQVARGPADGSAVVLCVMSMLAIAPELPGARLPIDPRTDLAGVALFALSPYGLVVGAQSPYRSLAQLVEAAKARPSAVSYASVGVGSAPHLGGALIGLRAPAEMVHVPYRGAAPALLDVIANRADFMMVSLGDVTKQIQDGDLRLLALGDSRPVPLFPNVPPISATLPGVESYTWFGLCGPRGMSAEGRARWERGTAAAVADPGFRTRLEAMGLVPLFEDGATMDRRIAADRELWGGVVRAANIRAE